MMDDIRFGVRRPLACCVRRLAGPFVHQTFSPIVFNHNSEPQSRRRAGDDSTRAACAPHFQ